MQRYFKVFITLILLRQVYQVFRTESLATKTDRQIAALDVKTRKFQAYVERISAAQVEAKHDEIERLEKWIENRKERIQELKEIFGEVPVGAGGRLWELPGVPVGAQVPVGGG